MKMITATELYGIAKSDKTVKVLKGWDALIAKMQQAAQNSDFRCITSDPGDEILFRLKGLGYELLQLKKGNVEISWDRRHLEKKEEKIRSVFKVDKKENKVDGYRRGNDGNPKGSRS